ncbi:hypothetical protein QYE76_055421 [Lolium multiflorum]|uniref:Transcription repressor n=1 Tax=Lolium multiflorum TaxID=4521 RepID=A0AAD8T0D5_LOLMU|nr:hypothetical protein QYE76_055421 [Lolium multiflorum]
MDGAGNGRKKLKHRLAAILSVFSRRSGGRKRRDEAAAPPPLALPSYARIGAGGNGNGKKVGGQHDRRLSVSARRAVPMIRITIDCAGRRSVDAADPSLLAPLDADANVKKMETSEWEGRQCPPSSPFPVAPLPPPPPRWTKDRTNTTARRLSTHSSRSRLLMSSSSSDDEYDEHSSRNLFSSRSFSSDSSDFYNCPRNKSTTTTTTTRPRASVSGPPCRAPPSSARRGASQSCRYSFELPRGSTASAATDGGFAVVKRSADPYEDFRRSMEEMIAGWPEGGHGLEGEEQDAEGLLETYLVLNSPRHYPAILAAFADVRETLCP